MLCCSFAGVPCAVPIQACSDQYYGTYTINTRLSGAYKEKFPSSCYYHYLSTRKVTCKHNGRAAGTVTTPRG